MSDEPAMCTATANLTPASTRCAPMLRVKGGPTTVSAFLNTLGPDRSWERMTGI